MKETKLFDTKHNVNVSRKANYSSSYKTAKRICEQNKFPEGLICFISKRSKKI